MQKSIKNILILAISLFIIMSISTVIVLGFNNIFGLSTNLNNDDVLTSISVVAFLIALILRYLYDKKT